STGGVDKYGNFGPLRALHVMQIPRWPFARPASTDLRRPCDRPLPHTGVTAKFWFLRRLFAAGLLDDLVGNCLRDLRVAVEGHRVDCTTLGLRTQVTNVTEHLR